MWTHSRPQRISRSCACCRRSRVEPGAEERLPTGPLFSLMWSGESDARQRKAWNSASVAAKLLPTGSTRYVAVATASSQSTASTTYEDVPDLATSINIPSVKHRDVIVLFCCLVRSLSIMDVQAVVGGGGIAPGDVELIQDSAGAAAENRCANSVRLAVPAGTRTVKMPWRADPALTAGTQQIWARTMIVIVKIRWEGAGVPSTERDADIERLDIESLYGFQMRRPGSPLNCEGGCEQPLYCSCRSAIL